MMFFLSDYQDTEAGHQPKYYNDFRKGQLNPKM
jgi:hypothetical protein